MRQRIADDPDTWGKPEDLEKKTWSTCPHCEIVGGHAPGCQYPTKPYTLPADPSAMATCPKCGVMWHYHDSSVCGAIQKGEYDEGTYAGLLVGTVRNEFDEKWDAVIRDGLIY